jgi:hypothetical protein
MPADRLAGLAVLFRHLGERLSRQYTYESKSIGAAQ